MKKRIISALLAGCMVVGLMTGCGNTDNKKGSGDDTLVVGIPQYSAVSSFEDNKFTEYLEQALGSEIEFEFFPEGSDEYTQQLSMIIGAEEELPDVLLGFTGMASSTIKGYGEEGYFLDLTDLIEEHAENYKAQLEKLTKEERARIKNSGTSEKTKGFYSLPLYSFRAIDNLQSMTYINKTWLDKLGLQVPTTVEELEIVLKAFKENDPNGNGQQDEIPMVGTTANMAAQGSVQDYIMNAFVYYNAADIFNVDSKGKVYSPATTAEWRQGVEYMNKLCSQGLLSDLTFNISSMSEYTSLIAGDSIAKVGIWSGHTAILAASATPLLEEYVALPALKAATDKGGYTVEVPNSLQWGGVITENCENPELAMKFLDLFFIDETVSRMRNGEKDVDWKDVKGTCTTGEETHIEVVNGKAFFEGNSTWCRNLLGILTPYNYLWNQTNESAEGFTKEAARLEKELWDILSNGKTKASVNEGVTSTSIYTEKESEERGTYYYSYRTCVREFLALCATGEKNIKDDATWDAFQKDLEKNGQKEIIKIEQAAYDRQAK